MSVVEELQEAGARVARTVGGSVVRIGRGRGRGAGIVAGDGVVVTNAHNLRGETATVTFSDGRSERGSLAGVDVDGDLAVLRVTTNGQPVVSWAEGGVELGAGVFSVTTPADATNRVTFGTVSAVDRAFRGPGGRLITGGIEHTAPLARGSSGSPIVDPQGRVVGVNTHRIGEGFYLAVPADADLRTRVDALIRGESPRRLYLGVALFPAGAARRLRASVGLPEREGLLVRGVDPDGPAGRSGVERGDLIVEAGGTPVARPDDLFDVLTRTGDDQSLMLRLVRGTDEIELRVTFDRTTTDGTEGSA
jgi:serine protease Do